MTSAKKRVPFSSCEGVSADQEGKKGSWGTHVVLAQDDTGEVLAVLNHSPNWLGAFGQRVLRLWAVPLARIRDARSERDVAPDRARWFNVLQMVG